MFSVFCVCCNRVTSLSDHCHLGERFGISGPVKKLTRWPCGAAPMCHRWWDQQPLISAYRRRNLRANTTVYQVVYGCNEDLVL